jgi:hypothetical protein
VQDERIEGCPTLEDIEDGAGIYVIEHDSNGSIKALKAAGKIK